MSHTPVIALFPVARGLESIPDLDRSEFTANYIGSRVGQWLSQPSVEVRSNKLGDYVAINTGPILHGGFQDLPRSIKNPKLTLDLTEPP